MQILQIFASFYILITRLIGVSFALPTEPFSNSGFSIPISKSVLKRGDIHPFIKKNELSYRNIRRSNDESVLEQFRYKEKLMNIYNIIYTLPISLGTPKQNLNVIIDTGSSNLWVNSYLCTNCNSLTTIYYDHTKSTTYHPNNTIFEIEYGVGSLHGFISQDTLQIGPYKMPKTLFAEAVSVAPQFTEGFFDGIMGLAYASIARNGILPPFNVMINDKVVTKPIFSIHLGDYNDTVQNSEIMFGGINREHYLGQISYTNVTKKAYWQVHLQSIFFNGTSIKLSSGTKTQAAIDSGTTLIVIPTEDAQNINYMLGFEYYDKNTGYHSTDCSKINKMQSIYFKFGGGMFELKPKHFVNVISSTQCVSAFYGMDLFDGDLATWILGDSFLRAVYTIYDFENHRVGFAKSKY